MSSLEAIELVDRIWARDPTIWTGSDEGHWLGWLDEPARMLERLGRARGPRVRLRARRAARNGRLEPRAGGDPADVRGRTSCTCSTRRIRAAIRRLEDHVDLGRTLFIAASKSGTTLETRSQLDYFLERGTAARRSRAITDPGTELEQFARDRDFAWVVHGEPTIGGPLLGAVAVRDGARGAARPRRQGDSSSAPTRWRAGAGWVRSNPGFQFGLRARRGLGRGPRQGLHRRDSRRVRALGRAADRGVDREAGQGPRAGSRRGSDGWPRPPARRGAARRPVRPRRGVLPLGVRDRGRRLDPRDQPLRPAGRPGREGQDERELLSARDSRSARAGRVTRRAARAGGAAAVHRDPGLHRPRARGRARSARRCARARPAAS